MFFHLVRMAPSLQDRRAEGALQSDVDRHRGAGRRRSRMDKTQGRRPTPRDAGDAFPHPLSTYLFHLFTAVGRLRDVRLDKALRPLGLNVSRHRAIAVIALLEPCTMSDLADLSAIDRTTMTRIVDQLVARGLTERTTRSQDRRQVLLNLTAEGHAVYAKALKVFRDVDKTALQGLPEETLRTLARAQQAMLRNLAPSHELARRLLEFRRE
jgi:DNA-binding MarR family transcriptional regulator